MSAMPQPKRKRPPRFSTYVDVDVDIDPEDLERAGWRYVGNDSEDGKVPTTEQAIDIVRRWHNDNHDGPWRWCQHDLCDQLRGRDNG